MSAGAAYSYLWTHPSGHNDPKSLTAIKYVNETLGWCESELDGGIEGGLVTADEEGMIDFPPYFDSIMKNTLCHFFRIYSHIYYTHYQHVSESSFADALELGFKWFIFFVVEHHLVFLFFFHFSFISSTIRYQKRKLHLFMTQLRDSMSLRVRWRYLRISLTH